MIEEKITLQNVRSADVLSGSSANPDVAKYFDNANSPKLPDASELEFGEVAFNIATGYEVIAIKNYDGEIVYLPFNLAERILRQEARIEDFRDEIITDFNTLSALTQTQLEQFILKNEEIAARIAVVSGAVDTLSAQTDGRIAQLSASTDTKISESESAIRDELSREIGTVNSRIASVSGSLHTDIVHTNERIDELSGNVYTKIDTTKEELEEKISAITSGSSMSLDELDKKVNRLSGDVYTSISELDYRIDEQHEYTDKRIENLSGETFEAISQLSGDLTTRIDNIEDNFGESVEEALRTSQVLSSVTTTIREEITSGDSELNQKIVAIRNSLGFDSEGRYNPSEAELSGMTVSMAIDYLNSEIRDIEIHYPGHSEVEAIREMIIALSASTDARMETLVEYVDNETAEAIEYSIDESRQYTDSRVLSAQTEISETIAEVYEKIDSVSAITDERISENDRKIQQNTEAIERVDDGVADAKYIAREALSASTYWSGVLNEKVDSLSSDTQEKLGALKDETAELVSETREQLQSQIEATSADTLTQSRQYTDEAVEGLQNTISATSALTLGTSTAYTDDRIAELSADTQQKIAGVQSATTEAIGNLEESLVQKIEDSSAKTLDDAREYTDDKVQSVVSSASATTLEEAMEYTDEKVSEIASGTSEAIHTLSAETFGKIASLRIGDLSDVNVKTIAKEDGDIEILIKTASGWTNSTIGYATAEKAGIIMVGSGLTVSGGVLSATPIEIDDEVIEGSRNAVSGGAVYREIEGVRERIDEVEERYEGIEDEFHELKDTVIEFSGETIERFESFSASVETHLTESDIVQAATLAKQNFELGFTENAEFQPEAEELQGRSVTEAIDYIYAKAEDVSGKCMTKYDTMYGIIEDDELTTAGAVTKINHYLGFNANAQYIPESTDLELMNVTEAIDYLYDKIGVVYDYIESEDDTHLMRSVTYEKLVELKQNRQLRWGMLYRITNYQATLSQTMSGTATTRMAVVESDTNTNNGFDILVRATSNHTLNENVLFMQSLAGKSMFYFEDCTVTAWSGKYSLDNDTKRFEWANEDGFGVIYEMRDEYGNEAPYDFKNIKFLNTENGKAIFTFGNKETSLSGTTYADFSNLGYARNNVIRPAFNDKGMQVLNKVFMSIDREAIGNEFAAGCRNIWLDGNFHNNIISPMKNGSTITNGTSGDTSCNIFGYVLA